MVAMVTAGLGSPLGTMRRLRAMRAARTTCRATLETGGAAL